jgi:hypothetical protein
MLQIGNVNNSEAKIIYFTAGNQINNKLSYHPKGREFDAYVTDVDANRGIGFSEELQRIEFLQFRYTDLLGKFLAKYVMSDYDELMALMLA